MSSREVLIRIRQYMEYLLAQMLLCLIQVVPIEWCVDIARRMAWLISDRIGFRRAIIDENLRAVFPGMSEDQRREMSRQMWYHLILMVCQIAQAPRKIHDTNWRKYITIRDLSLMTSYLYDYRPLVAVSGHFGNFEISGYTTGLFGIPTYSVARPLDNPLLDEMINEFRARNRQFVLPKDGSANAIQEVLINGGILTMLGDQHAGTKGCWVEFLGRPAACHKALALFTLSGNAPLMVGYCRQTERPMHFEIGCTGVADPLTMPDSLRDVTSLTQWYNDRLAEAIHLAPAQYWWVHRRWKEKPVRKTKRQREAAA